MLLRGSPVVVCITRMIGATLNIQFRHLNSKHVRGDETFNDLHVVLRPSDLFVFGFFISGFLHITLRCLCLRMCW